MTTADIYQQLQYLAHEGLVWVGFGTVVGLVAKAIMPGKDPGGAVVTLLVGIAGSLIGGGSLALLMPNHRVTPISPLGFMMATGGALLLLIFFRLFLGRWFLPDTRQIVSTVQPVVTVAPARRRVYSRARRGVQYEIDE